MLRKSTHSVLFGVFALTILSWYGEQRNFTAAAVALQRQMHGAATDERGEPIPYEGRVYRLQKRVRKAFGKTYDLATLQDAVKTRSILLQRSLTVHWDVVTGAEVEPWVASVGGYPTWVKAVATGQDFTFRLDQDRIAGSLTLNPPSGITLPKD
ncbi:MAG: hypothetical protein AAB728_04095, partial [Patescibacteria group bacterium]